MYTIAALGKRSFVCPSCDCPTQLFRQHPRKKPSPAGWRKLRLQKSSVGTLIENTVALNSEDNRIPIKSPKFNRRFLNQVPTVGHETSGSKRLCLGVVLLLDRPMSPRVLWPLLVGT